MSSTEEKKTIQFNPDIFKIPDKHRTRKKRNANNDDNNYEKKGVNQIHMKTNLLKPSKQRNETLRKKVLKHIREKQEENYKKNFDDIIEKYSSLKPALTEPSTLTITDFNVNSNQKTPFEDSVEFLQNISNEVKTHNHTLKQQPSTAAFFAPLTTNPLSNALYPQPSFPSYPLPEHNPITNNGLSPIHLQPKPHQIPPPQYGCLKNGNLPTYRTYINKTNRNNPAIHTTSIQPKINNFLLNEGENQAYQPNQPNQTHNIIQNEIENRLGEPQTKLTEEEKTMNMNQKIRDIMRNKENIKINTFENKRKKTLKRTFSVGKSKVYSKVGVLIKNKTLRNRITTEKQLLKQKPIEDIKRHLMKNGLIRVGTTAPNDVLRQIYECTMMIGGELHNFNSDNLLYNYLNGEKNISQ